MTKPNLRFPAVCCENLWFSAKICGFLRFPAPSKCLNFQEKFWALSVTLVPSYSGSARGLLPEIPVRTPKIIPLEFTWERAPFWWEPPFLGRARGGLLPLAAQKSHRKIAVTTVAASGLATISLQKSQGFSPCRPQKKSLAASDFWG